MGPSDAGSHAAQVRGPPRVRRLTAQPSGRAGALRGNPRARRSTRRSTRRAAAAAAGGAQLKMADKTPGGSQKASSKVSARRRRRGGEAAAVVRRPPDAAAGWRAWGTGGRARRASQPERPAVSTWAPACARLEAGAGGPAAGRAVGDAGGGLRLRRRAPAALTWRHPEAAAQRFPGPERLPGPERRRPCGSGPLTPRGEGSAPPPGAAARVGGAAWPPGSALLSARGLRSCRRKHVDKMRTSLGGAGAPARRVRESVSP